MDTSYRSPKHSTYFGVRDKNSETYRELPAIHRVLFLYRLYLHYNELGSKRPPCRRVWAIYYESAILG